MAEWNAITPTTEAMLCPGGMLVRCSRDSDDGGIAAMVFVPAIDADGDTAELRHWIKENKQ